MAHHSLRHPIRAVVLSSPGSSVTALVREDLAMRIDWGQFDRDEDFRNYFRYKLHEKDFRPAVDGQGRTLGHFYAKPLYGRLDERGRVDTSAGFNGEIAIAFAEPSEGHLTLLFIHLPKEEIVRADGRKNWPAIREAARRRICEHLGVAS
jgi:hypothetical protein